MKRIVISAIAIAFLAGIVSAANFSSIAFIDVQKVFKDYKETSKAQKELGLKEDEFKKAFEESQKKLEKAEKDGKSKADLEKMKKELEDSLSPKRETLLKLNEQLTSQLQQKILASVKTVAKKVGVDMVLDKQVVITGGMDITDMVVSELNK